MTNPWRERLQVDKAPPILQGWGKNGKSTPESRGKKKRHAGRQIYISAQSITLCSHGGVVALVGVVEGYVWAKKHTVKYYLQATCKREIVLGSKTVCQGSFHQGITDWSIVDSFALKCSKQDDKTERQDKRK